MKIEQFSLQFLLPTWKLFVVFRH